MELINPNLKFHFKKPLKRADFLSQQNSSAPKMKTATVMEIVMMENVTVTMDGNLQIAQVIKTSYEIYNEFVSKRELPLMVF